VWWLGITCAASLGGLVAAWAVRHRMARELAVVRDRRARDAHSARVEVTQLRRGLADVLVVQAATAVVDNALRGLGSREKDQ
jgi:hypothetical protein